MYLDEAGQVYTWGDNSRGQLGNGTTQQSAKPAMVPGLENVAAISAGYQHGLAISRQARSGRTHGLGR